MLAIVKSRGNVKGMAGSPSKATVLILNYHQATNRAFVRLLATKGIVAHATESADEAMAMAGAHRYQLLVCRYSVCLDRGVDLIGEFWKRFGIPGVLLTGKLNEEEAAKFVLPEAYRGALLMPVSFENLLATLRRAMPEKCPDCLGTGQIVLLVSKKPCLKCGGKGWV